jgi:hypothetical protein
VHPHELLGAGAAGEEHAHLVQLRAISSMRYLAKQVPEVEPFLWGLFETDDPATKVNAFSTLQAIGFKPADLDPLVSALTSSGRSPALTRYLPQAITELLRQDPQAAAPAVTRLQGFLDSPDSAARFMSACALAGTYLDRDPRIGAVLNEALASSDTTQVLSAAEALAKAGPAAKGFAPALLQLAQTVPEKHLRAEYLRAAAAIAPELSGAQPAVAAVLAQDAQARELRRKMETESATQDELMAALALPQFSTMAAVRLGELGLAASNAAPAMVKALEGHDEAARDKIVEALTRVNPNFSVERIDAPTVTHAVIEAEISLGDRVHNHSDPAVQFLLDKRKFSTWWTRGELISVAGQLAKLDAKAYAAFLDKILQSYPDLRSELPVAKP